MIVSGKKSIELRSWNTNYRGEFLVHAPLKVRTGDSRRLKIDKKFVTGAIIGRVQIYDVKEYDSAKEIELDKEFHFASRKFQGKTFGFLLKNAKQLRVSIPWKGQLGFFDADIPKTKTKDTEIVADIIDEEYRYQWIGRH